MPGGQAAWPGLPCLHKASSMQNQLLESTLCGAPGANSPGGPSAAAHGNLLRFLSEPSRGYSEQGTGGNPAALQVRRRASDPACALCLLAAPPAHRGLSCCAFCQCPAGEPGQGAGGGSAALNAGRCSLVSQSLRWIWAVSCECLALDVGVQAGQLKRPAGADCAAPAANADSGRQAGCQGGARTRSGQLAAPGVQCHGTAWAPAGHDSGVPRC